MHFTIQREALLKPLQLVAGVVERRQTLPVLSNVLLVVQGQQLSLTGTDLEVELVGRVQLEEPAEPGEITVPARKLMDICKSLPNDALIDIKVDEQKVVVKAGRSRFTLSTLPANDFPTVEEGPGSLTCSLVQSKLRRLIERTSFAMAQQDVRYYLNGLLFDLRGDALRTVATDGHRLALCETELEKASGAKRQIIVPRKGVTELQRLLESGDREIELEVGRSHVRVKRDDVTFTSKLIDGRFPDYEAVIPIGADREVKVDREALRASLQRAAILSNEKYRGIRVEVSPGNLKISAHNPEQEEAQEEIEADTTVSDLAIGFNVNYLLDALSALRDEHVVIQLRDSNSSALVREASSEKSRHVVMPLRL
ncbi:DNA polymerase III subunit beta [Pseudomonas sp. UBA6276]|uniref:DNA polymerase III subunit beta n=1 Tax=Pseudomonas sp. UBA6276 TaxID=1947324 RepID=UPI00257CDBFD|nr:DNA polymerase III subunit beta [Pseudomonas sp. UBA6276]